MISFIKYLRQGSFLLKIHNYGMLRSLYREMLTRSIIEGVIIAAVSGCVSMLLLSHLSYAAWCLIAIPLLPFILTITAWSISHRHVRNLALDKILPVVGVKEKTFETEMKCTKEDFIHCLNGLVGFSSMTITDPAMRNRVMLCIEETMLLVVRYKSMARQSVWIRLVYTGDEMLVFMKGEALDALEEVKADGTISMSQLLIRNMCPRLKHTDTMVEMAWFMDDSRNHYTTDHTEVSTEDEESFDLSSIKNPPIISLHGIHKTYMGASPLHVLKGVNLDIEQGEFVSIMGPSGSGKSTMLNVIGILDDYDDGEYHLAGRLIKNLTTKQSALCRNELIGFIFQSYNLINYKTAVENVEVPLTYRGIPAAERRKQALEYLAKVGLQGHSDHRPTQMSGGQCQRVAIARALVQHPQIILADEPTGALDSKTSREVLELLREVNRNDGLTIIIVTHEKEIADMTDRQIVFGDGIIVSDSKHKTI